MASDPNMSAKIKRCWQVECGPGMVDRSVVDIDATLDKGRTDFQTLGFEVSPSWHSSIHGSTAFGETLA